MAEMFYIVCREF